MTAGKTAVVVLVAGTRKTEDTSGASVVTLEAGTSVVDGGGARDSSRASRLPWPEDVVVASSGGTVVSGTAPILMIVGGGVVVGSPRKGVVIVVVNCAKTFLIRVTSSCRAKEPPPWYFCIS